MNSWMSRKNAWIAVRLLAVIVVAFGVGSLVFVKHQNHVNTPEAAAADKEMIRERIAEQEWSGEYEEGALELYDSGEGFWLSVENDVYFARPLGSAMLASGVILIILILGCPSSVRRWLGNN